jgi:hypothetical protein
MGVLQEIGVRRLGFPVRVPVREFAATYAPVVGISVHVEAGQELEQEAWRKICIQILENRPAQEGVAGYLWQYSGRTSGGTSAAAIDQSLNHIH